MIGKSSAVGGGGGGGGERDGGGDAEIRTEMQSLIEAVVKEWYQPEVNGFQPRSE